MKRCGGCVETNHIGLIAQALQACLRSALAHRLIGALSRLHVTPVHIEFVTLLVEHQHAGFLRVHSALQFTLPVFTHPISGFDRSRNTRGLTGQTTSEGGQLGLGTLAQRMVDTQVHIVLIDLGFETRDIGFQTVDQRALHYFCHRIAPAIALALAVCGFALNRRQLGRNLAQLGGFIVHPLIG